MKKLLKLEKKLIEIREQLEKAMYPAPKKYVPAKSTTIPEKKQEAPKPGTAEKKQEAPKPGTAEKPMPIGEKGKVTVAHAGSDEHGHNFPIHKDGKEVGVVVKEHKGDIGCYGGDEDEDFEDADIATKIVEEHIKKHPENYPKPVKKSLDERINDLLVKALNPESEIQLAAHQNAREAKEAKEAEDKKAAHKIAIAKMNEAAKETEGKEEAKPEKQGSFHNEAHTSVQERGTRLVSFPTKEKDANGKSIAGRKHVVNKVKVTHVWDDNSKKWNHKSTENVLPGLTVKGNDRDPEAKAKVAKQVHHETPDTAADAKMKAHEAAKNAPKAEPVKPKTIVRKK